MSTNFENLVVPEKDVKAFGASLCRLLRLDLKAAEAATAHIFPEGTEFQHVIGQMADELPRALKEAKVEVKNRHFLKDAIPVLNLFRPGMAICKECGCLPIWRVSGALVVRSVGETCPIPECGRVLTARATVAVTFNWYKLEMVPDTDDNHILTIGSSNIPVTRAAAIMNRLNDRGGLHHQVQEVMEHFGLVVPDDLPYFVGAVFSTQRRTYEEKPLRAVLSLSAKLFDTDLTTLNELEAWALAAVNFKKQATRRVEDMQLPPSPQVPPAPVSLPKGKRAFRSLVLGLLGTALQLNDDFDAFVTKYFPQTHQLLPVDFLEKRNFLVDKHGLREVYRLMLQSVKIEEWHLVMVLRWNFKDYEPLHAFVNRYFPAALPRVKGQYGIDAQSDALVQYAGVPAMLKALEAEFSA